MANKTRPTKTSANAVLNKIAGPTRRSEGKALLGLMKRVTGMKPVVWGDSMIGFGEYHYRYASGREGDFLMTGFAVRKANLTVYIMPGFKGMKGLLGRLGPHKTSVSCLYIRSLEKIDLEVLSTIVEKSMVKMKRIYPENRAT